VDLTATSDGRILDPAGKELGLGGNECKVLTFGGGSIRLHRIIYRIFHGAILYDFVVDHIDNNSWNNHPDNLQLLSASQNIAKDVGNESPLPALYANTVEFKIEESENIGKLQVRRGQ